MHTPLLVKPLITVILGFLALTWLGCGPATEENVKSTPPAGHPPTAGTADLPREIAIEVGDSMKFSLVRIEAVSGETLRVTLVNRGVAPKDTMAHNWVLLRAGANAVAFANAAVKAKATDYLPPELAPEVLAHTELLGGGRRDAVTFTAPVAGTYEFICTFPAHLQLGMRGVLVVKDRR